MSLAAATAAETLAGQTVDEGLAGNDNRTTEKLIK